MRGAALVLLLLIARPRPVPGRNRTLARAAREAEAGFKYLVFPQGSNIQVVYCLTIGALAKPEGFFTLGVTAGLAYELPYRRTVPHRKPAEVYHRRSRRDLYRNLEAFFKTQGKDGRACVLRALCEAGRRNRQPELQRAKAPFFEEILHAVFTFPAVAEVEADAAVGEYDRAYGSADDCGALVSACPRLL